MPYTPNGHSPAESSDELRARIPGWGADLNPADRPAVPREQQLETGAHWDFPERQPELAPREKSIEHLAMPPVFGTSAPLKGISGMMRRAAYARYSEARAAHWLILIAADRVDAIESHLVSFTTTRPDNPLTETGIRAEFTHNGWGSRVGRKRVDGSHTWIDPILVAGPWVLSGALVISVVRAVAKAGANRSS
jgi:hypothetical protein